MVYTHVTRPLTTNFDRTPVADGFVAKGDVKELRYNSYLRVIWDVNSIGAVANLAPGWNALLRIAPTGYPAPIRGGSGRPESVFARPRPVAD